MSSPQKQEFGKNSKKDQIKIIYLLLINNLFNSIAFLVIVAVII